MEGFLTQGWELILPGCDGISALARGATLAGSMSPSHQQSPSGLGFPHPTGRYRTGGSLFSSPGCWSCRDMEGFLIRGWKLILRGCGGTSALARGATLAARWCHEPQPISNRPVVLGFPHPAGRYRPGGSAFSSPSCWSCRDMDLLVTRGCEVILPGCGGTLALSRGATLAARWLHEPQPISNDLVGLGLAHPAGRYGPEENCGFIPGLLEL